MSGGSLLTLDFSLFLESFLVGLCSFTPFTLGALELPCWSAFNCCS